MSVDTLAGLASIMLGSCFGVVFLGVARDALKAKHHLLALWWGGMALVIITIAVCFVVGTVLANLGKNTVPL